MFLNIIRFNVLIIIEKLEDRLLRCSYLENFFAMIHHVGFYKSTAQNKDFLSDKFMWRKGAIINIFFIFLSIQFEYYFNEKLWSLEKSRKGNMFSISFLSWSQVDLHPSLFLDSTSDVWSLFSKVQTLKASRIKVI